jgi:transcriptional regulator with XRE-family HTH domain
MSLPADQRRLLSSFLRSRREALTPASAGQPINPHARRRTPGLRREEVAQLCGLSTTWYTWIEQGREITLSATALARLADALRLSPAERAYLFELTRRRDPTPPINGSGLTATPGELMAVLQGTVVPAYLLDRLWHGRGWNDAAKRLFSPWLDSGETCLLRYVFLNPTAHDFIHDWDDRARRLLAEFRADTAHAPHEPEMQELVCQLLDRSAAFARFWNNYAVLAREGGIRLFNHPQDGRLRYQQITFVPATHPDYKLVMLLPE